MAMGGLMALGAVMMLFVLAMFVALYVYMALVLSTIARKLRYKKTWLAWIPFANLALFPILAKKHWAWVFIFLVPIVGLVFYIIWTWNIFEQRRYSGWLSLVVILSVIPFIGWLASIANLVIWGVVAWRDN